jgi:MoaA/NifB/PqqE/SkfB family radical SAM enzyme
LENSARAGVDEIMNKTLCILPWISLETSPIGTARPCCLAEEEIVDNTGTVMSVQDHDLMSIYNGTYMQDLRTAFRDGKKPATCKKCWVEEEAGRSSKRINTIHKFSDKISGLDISRNTVDKIEFLDLKLGNICNLKCRICGSWSSSKWAGEEIDYLKVDGVSKEDQRKHTAYTMLKKGAWPRQSDAFWKSLDTILEDIEYFEFTGGEPLMIQEHHDLLKRAVDKGYAPNIAIHYNTNSTKSPEEFQATWKHFKRVEIALSIDNVGKRFEYERHPANWEEANLNARKFEQLRKDNSNIDFQLCFTVNVLNVLYLDELLEWASDIAFDHYHWNMLHGPEELSIACLPEIAKQKIIEILRNKNFDSKFANDINNIISMMQNGKSQDGKLLVSKLQKTDLYRKEHLKQTHPELAAILNYN